jgi:hypothetical protein
MTPNRFDGRDSTRWLNDLPPRIRARFTPVFESDPEPVVEKPRTERRYSRVAGRFFLVLLIAAFTNIVVILLALWILGLPAPHEAAPNP